MAEKLVEEVLFRAYGEAIRKNFKEATDDQIHSAMGLHFKQAPARTGGGGYRRPRTPVV